MALVRLAGHRLLYSHDNYRQGDRVAPPNSFIAFACSNCGFLPVLDCTLSLLRDLNDTRW